VGLTAREPTLFATTIQQHHDGSHRRNNTRIAVAAAKGANAHDFVSALPEGYDVSVNGVQLSGVSCETM
jgi:ATP-binding cassette subfamily B (MDR/TAP) protein 1